MAKSNRVKKKLIAIGIIMILVITVLFIMLMYMAYNTYDNNLYAIEEEVIKKYDQQYQTILHGYQQLVNNYYNEIIVNDNIMKTMHSATYANEDELENLREELKRFSQEIYKRASADNLDDFSFILYDNTNFLNLSNNQLIESSLSYNENENFENKMQESKSYNSFLYRYPLIYNDEHVGYIEISVRYSSITKLMSSLFNIESAFIISKPIIEDTLHESQIIKEDYRSLPFTNEYYLDKDSFSRPKDFAALHEKVFEELVYEDLYWYDADLMSYQDNFFITISYPDIDYSLVFLRINNIANNNGGYFIFIDEDSYFYTLRTSVIYQYIALVFIWALIVIIGIILLLNRNKIEKITYYDKLTSAYNRNKLFEFIESEIQKNAKKNTSLSILLIDVDKFKSINDTYGHLKGDEILKMITALLFQNVRSTDMVFRYGGDEFLILLPNTPLDAAKHVATSIKEVVNTTKWETLDSPVTLSIGVAQYNQTESIDQLISRSDNMLYKAKEYGRNCVFGDV